MVEGVIYPVVGGGTAPEDEVLVNWEYDFGLPDGDKIQLAPNKTYNLQRKTIVVNHYLCFPYPTGSVITNGILVMTKGFRSTEPNAGIEFFSGQINHVGTAPAFDLTDFTFLRLRNANLITTSGAVLFDVVSSGLGLLSGTFQLDTVLLAGFPPGGAATLGILKQCNVDLSGTTCLGFFDGFNFIDNFRVSVDRVEMFNGVNIPGNIFMEFSGTIPGILFNIFNPIPQSNEYVFYFNPALLTSGVVANNIIYNLSSPGVSEANIFAPGSLDQTVPGIIMKGNTHLNSQTFADVYFKDNIEETELTVDVPAPINATVFDSIERFQLEHNLIYDAQTVDFTVGQPLSQGAVTGTIIADDDQGTTGTLTLIDVTGGAFQSGVLITDGLGGSANLVATHGRLKYIDIQGISLKVTLTTTLQPVTGVNIQMSTYIAKNNIAIDRSEGKKRVSALADTEETLFSQVIVDLVFGDYLEPFIANRQTSSNANVYDMSFIAGG